MIPVGSALYARRFRITTALSSRAAFYLVTVGAAVGLGSIWRFPYLVGRYGGGTFIAVFIIACFLIAIPLLVAEFILGRAARCSPPDAAGEVAAQVGLSRRWNAIGWFGTLSAFLVFSYYSIIAGWVLAYVWETARGSLIGQSHAAITDKFHALLSNPMRMIAWQLLFMLLIGVVSSSGIRAGIERISKVRAPALLALLIVLVVYALCVGDTTRGLAFAFAPHAESLSGGLLLAAVSQAFYATGVGMAMMIAYGAYVPAGVSLVRSSLILVASIVIVSIMATLVVFPLVFRYGLDPAQGPKLVFEVLPMAFAEMPGGRLIGTIFFALLVLAALTPSIALLEPAVAWLGGRGIGRQRAVIGATLVSWCLGLGSVLSFNAWADWHPLKWLPGFGNQTYFDVVDFFSANILLPVGALLTSILVGWRLSRRSEYALHPLMNLSLRYVCPIAIVAVLISAFV